MNITFTPFLLQRLHTGRRSSSVGLLATILDLHPFQRFPPPGPHRPSPQNRLPRLPPASDAARHRHRSTAPQSGAGSSASPASVPDTNGVGGTSSHPPSWCHSPRPLPPPETGDGGDGDRSIGTGGETEHDGRVKRSKKKKREVNDLTAAG